MSIKYDEISYEGEEAKLLLDGVEVDTIYVPDLVERYLEEYPKLFEEFDRYDIENSPKKVWALEITSRLDDIHSRDVVCYNAEGEPDGDVYDDGFCHSTRDGVRFVGEYPETASDTQSDKYTRAWARKVDRVISKG
jgi:hypothetical protein